MVSRNAKNESKKYSLNKPIYKDLLCIYTDIYAYNH